MTKLRIVGSLRDWRNARDWWRLARRAQLPDSIERRYRDRTEHVRDAAGLTTLGYTQVSRGETNLFVHQSTAPAASDEVIHPLDCGVQRQAPSFRVHYTRQACDSPSADTYRWAFRQNDSRPSPRRRVRNRSDTQRASNTGMLPMWAPLPAPSAGITRVP